MKTKYTPAPGRWQRFALAILALLVVALSACGPGAAPGSSAEGGAGSKKPQLLSVHYLDVGQADSILVQLPGGENVLIDGGNAADGEKVVDYLKKAGVRSLTAVVATHPHEDHIGGLPAVLAAFPVRTCYLPRRVTTSRTYAQLLTVLEEKKALVREARTGVTLDLQQPGVKAEFLGPVRTDYEDLNNVSAVLKVTYGKTAFLFMGDASAAAEKDLLRLGNLRADVLKVGHHGSSSATGAAFLRAVRPQVAVISVGKSNDYGHPSQATLRRLAAAQVKVWRSDHTGNIIVTSSGTKIDVKGEKASADR